MDDVRCRWRANEGLVGVVPDYPLYRLRSDMDTNGSEEQSTIIISKRRERGKGERTILFG